MSYLIKVTIAGTDVTQYVEDFNNEGSIEDDFDKAEIILFADVTDAISTFKVGDEVTIQRGYVTATDDYLFRGAISEVNKQSPNITIKAFDKLWVLSRKEYTKSYDKVIDTQGGNVSSIFYDLAVTQGGLNGTFDGTIQDSGSAVLLNKFIMNHDKIFNKLVELRKLLDWQMYYNPSDDKVYFEPLGTTPYSGGSLQVGTSGNVINIPKWTYDYNQMINLVNVIGAEQLVETTETFNGDGSNLTFALSYVPRSVKVFVITGGTSALKVGGVERSTTSYDYTVDKTPEVKSIIFEAASVPAAGTANVEVQYSYPIPIPVQGEDATSRSKYGDFQETKFYEDVKTVTDAENRVISILDRYSLPFVKTKLETTGVFGIVAGMTVEVVDQINNESRTLLVKRTRHKYPEESDTLDVGNEDWKLYDWLNKLNERLSRFERQNDKNQQIIIQINLTKNDYFYDNRYLKMLRNIVGDGFILDHTTQGILGAAGQELGKGSGWEENILNRLVHPDDQYIEEFSDTDFKNSTNTTATWDTTNKQITF